MNKEFKSSTSLFHQINWPRLMLMVWLLWTINSIFSTFQSGLYRASKGDVVNWMHIFWYVYTSALTWMAFTPLIAWMVFRSPIDTNRWAKTLFNHLLFALVISFPQRFLHLTIDYFIQNHFDLWAIQISYKEYLSSSLVSRTLGGLVTYFVIATMLYGYFFYLKNAENKSIQANLLADLNKSRIQNLKRQIQPHFLFNSMQLISNLMHKNLEKADEAIAQLSDLLRLSINQLEVDEILLSSEIDGIKKYLHLQELRFGKNVSSKIVCDPKLHMAKVPAMLLQPLVENAIQYGFEQTGKPTHIDIWIKKEKESLSIKIIDDGLGFDYSKTKNGTGIVIKNILTRLQSLYGDDFEFNFENRKPGTEINIQLPFRPGTKR